MDNADFCYNQTCFSVVSYMDVLLKRYPMRIFEIHVTFMFIEILFKMLLCFLTVVYSLLLHSISLLLKWRPPSRVWCGMLGNLPPKASYSIGSTELSEWSYGT